MMNTENDILLHRLIMTLDNFPLGGTREGEERLQVHHINGIGWDCRRRNLVALSAREHYREHSDWVENDMIPWGKLTKTQQEKATTFMSPYLLLPHGLFSMDEIGNNTENKAIPGSSQSKENNPSPKETFSLLPPISMDKIRMISRRKDLARRLEKIVLAIKDCGGQGMLSDFKDPTFLKGISSSALNRALHALEEAGVIQVARIGRGFPDHYRLTREVLL